MSVTPLRSRHPDGKSRHQVVRALLPARMAADLQRAAAATGLSTEALAALALADFVLKLRRKRSLHEQRAEPEATDADLST